VCVRDFEAWLERSNKSPGVKWFDGGEFAIALNPKREFDKRAAASL
jgi:hypothetical protein